MNIELPNLTMILISYAAAAVLSVAGVASLQGNFRVNGIVNWMLFFLLAPLPVLAGVPLASLVALDPFAALPPVAMTAIVAMVWVYLVLPALLPDFQVDSFQSAMVPSILIAGGLFIGGLVTNGFPNGLLLGSTDDQNVFVDRSAGTDLLGADPDKE